MRLEVGAGWQAIRDVVLPRTLRIACEQAPAVWLFSFLAAFASAAELDPVRVVILANSADPDSLRVARHYAAARAVPEENIVALPLSLAEGITWREFVTTLWDPLLTALVRAKWIDAIAMALTDPVGRTKYAPHGHRIAALVVCRGVPLRIAHDQSLYVDAPPFTARGEFRTNAGAVDSELSLLPLPNYAINAFLPNPLYWNDRPNAYQLGQIVRVSRLDGPTVEDALALIDNAIAAERTGVLGRAYIDVGNGPDPLGDVWFEDAGKKLRALHFDTAVDRVAAVMPETARMDAPAFYFGWYSGTVNGPVALPGFRFPPGAIALHLHSFSASTVRSATSGWTGPLIAHGATATVGNVHEPYLHFTHRPDLFVHALVRGDTLVEAAYYALQALSWQPVLIGDPLYRPLLVPLETQLKELAKLPRDRAGYAVLRRMNELDAATRRDEATSLARTAQREVPSLAVGVALARRLLEAGDKRTAAAELGFVAFLKTFPTSEWALVREAAQVLELCGEPRGALELWRSLLAAENLTRELRLAWLPDAKKCADAARDEAQAAAWARELAELNPAK